MIVKVRKSWQLIVIYIEKSKHIKYHFVKDAVMDKLIVFKYLQTDEMPADVLTKALSPAKRYNCIKNLGLVEM